MHSPESSELNELQALLLLLAQEIGEETPDGDSTWVRLTHQQLAESDRNNSNVTVTRNLSYFSEKKDGYRVTKLVT